MASSATAGGAAEPEPEYVPSPAERYNCQVAFRGARLEVLPLNSCVVPGFVQKVPVLFQFVTGKDPAPKREPFTLVIVLDVSGSMAGSKLTNCKTAIQQLLDCADDDDVLSLVTYSGEGDARVDFEGVRCGDAGARRTMKEKLAEVESRGGTDVYGGLLEGYNLLRRQGNAVNRHIFLLSDGQVTSGRLQKTEAILSAVSEWEEKVPILSYGIGDGFNEKLMSPLGQVHRGSHYFYIVDAASIEGQIGKGVRALTGAVARDVALCVRPLTPGLWLPEHMIDGASFPLVREKSVIQFLVEVEARPELTTAAAPPASDGTGWPCARRSPQSRSSGAEAAGGRSLAFAWEVRGFPLLERCSGEVRLRPAAARGPESEEVRTFLDVRRGCELRRGASGSAEARMVCEQALKLFEARLAHDRFGFAEEWANKTRALLQDASLWRGGAAGDGAAKHLGVAHRPHADEEEEEEEEMDFDLFG